MVGTGKLDRDEFEQMVGDKLSGLPEGDPFEREADPGKPESRFFYKFKETEQYHVSMGSLGIPAGSEDRYAMAALNNVLGGGMSSRLFQEVREKRGPRLRRLLLPPGVFRRGCPEDLRRIHDGQRRRGRQGHSRAARKSAG